MKQQILHTSEGVRDIYGIECERKLIIEQKLQKVLHLYGYHDIQTPMFEFFEVFGKEMGTAPMKELYKFFDREGNILVLRPDITPSIARVAATVFEEEHLPARLCYIGNTFKNRTSYQGRLHENTQLGAEFIGVDSPEADAEMIALAVDCLKAAGLEEFQINIGNVDFFESLIEDTNVSEEEEKRLRELISNRNYFGVEELLEQAQVKKTTKAAFQVLPELVGGVEILKDAKVVALNNKALDAVKRLGTTYEILVAYGIEKHVTFDLSMSGTYGYYTGIIFRGYTYGSGDAIVKGGRYDQLLGKFGKDAPSIGFAIVIDELLNAFTRQKLSIPYQCKNRLIVYVENRTVEAIKYAKKFREQEKQTELIKKETDHTIEDYINYAKHKLCGSILYLGEQNQIVMYNLLTGEKKVAKAK